jgi:TraM recognition site of TraD and TraG
MLSDSAGKGVLMTAVCHSVSQLEERWGKHGAGTIWSTCGTKVLLGSISDPDTLEHASKLCGTVKAGDDRQPAVPPELLRMLPEWRALVIRMNLSPVAVKVRPAWRRSAYRLGRHPLPVPARTWRPSTRSASAYATRSCGSARWADVQIPDPVPAAAEVPEFAPALNGHGGQPDELTEFKW